MEHIFLCGHTGSKNRGCDAIIRATAHILRRCGARNISAMTFHEDEDRVLNLDRCVELVAYPQKSLPQRAASLLCRKLMGDGVWGNRAYYRGLFQKAKPGDLLLNVGGDTYCYGKPYLSYALNDMAAEKGIPTVFWGCSLDHGLLREEQMRRDLEKYTWIVAREGLSFDMIRESVSHPERVLQGSDPAFWLEPEPVDLPKGFQTGNTLGLNLSPLVFAQKDSDMDMTWQNAVKLVDYVLEQTDMAVCLIPHVYDIEKNTQDIAILRRLKEKYAAQPRVVLVEREYSSAQLKYIIARCRFFIGARTHSMIAAYSSGVPALALSYSLKSLGIARDLFGTQEGYTVSWKDLDREDRLLTLFREFLLDGEEQMKQRYARLLPEYRNRMLVATQTILDSMENGHA